MQVEFLFYDHPSHLKKILCSVSAAKELIPILQMGRLPEPQKISSENILVDQPGNQSQSLIDHSRSSPGLEFEGDKWEPEEGEKRCARCKRIFPETKVYFSLRESGEWAKGDQTTSRNCRSCNFVVSRITQFKRGWLQEVAPGKDSQVLLNLFGDSFKSVDHLSQLAKCSKSTVYRVLQKLRLGLLLSPSLFEILSRKKPLGGKAFLMKIPTQALKSHLGAEFPSEADFLKGSKYEEWG